MTFGVYLLAVVSIGMRACVVPAGWRHDRTDGAVATRERCRAL
jgi:hypothetical protein